MRMTNEEYGRLVARMAKPSPMGKDLLFAFLIGGGICAVGQLIQTGWQALGLDRESAGTATTMTLIFLSALFTALDCYNSLAKYAGAGTLVPVTGFANSVVSPAIEFKSEGLVGPGGMASKMFAIAGPVIVFGVGASVIYGLILCLFQL
ncbi:MAG: SpoVA/SpoVAEb family sporulation membrane protein [Oscillospiraceae bacterium]|nr:SpoVA/SpoVAEb family sporulation membrane protein [Eubacteriales bacterium]MDY2617435.1 SpoVA/SpoVAEb family sporulation membrane protein [Oscillospiraceae bacterium]